MVTVIKISQSSVRLPAAQRFLQIMLYRLIFQVLIQIQVLVYIKLRFISLNQNQQEFGHVLAPCHFGLQESSELLRT